MLHEELGSSSLLVLRLNTMIYSRSDSVVKLQSFGACVTSDSGGFYPGPG